MILAKQKKVLFVLVSLLFSLAFIGCSASSSASSKPLFTDQAWPDNFVTQYVPAPEFSQPIDSITTSDSMVDAYWVGLDDEEVIAYAEKVKAADFTVNPYETKSSASYFYSARHKATLGSPTNITIQYSVADERNQSKLRLYVTRSI